MKAIDFLAYDDDEYPYRVLYAFDEDSRGTIAFKSYQKARQYYDFLRKEAGAVAGAIYVNDGRGAARATLMQDNFGLEELSAVAV